jgi:hypothetical protein
MDRLTQELIWMEDIVGTEEHDFPEVVMDRSKTKAFILGLERYRNLSQRVC